ncbi:FtsQ-type POTRA domain-containing protein [Anaerotignum faecicola]|nr:FtsQ-type POTRA domain-containing protein [Anaerotignum faecicola]
MKKMRNELTDEFKGRNKGRKKIKAGKTLLFFIVVAGAVSSILFSPLFTVREVNVNGIKKFTADEICEITGINTGINIFSVSTGKAEDKLKENVYIESVRINRTLPDKVDIIIDERRVRGYVPYMGSYLYIDEYGRVLEINQAVTEPLPVVTGLAFNSFSLGQKIDCENPEAFDIIVTIAQVMTKYDMLDTVVRIDVSDTNKIMAYVRKVEINLGDGTNCDEKIRTMSEVIKQIPENDRGTLDLSDLSKPIVFKYLT